MREVAQKGYIMRIKETKVYTYGELSDRAKEKARDWLREANAGDNFFAEFITDDFLEALKALGFDVLERRGNYLDPRDPRANRNTIEWSGFWSQGDGASFSGSWRARDCDPAELLFNRPATYEHDGKTETSKSNAELHRIAAKILEVKTAGASYAKFIKSNRGHFMRIDECEWTDGMPCESMSPGKLQTREEELEQAARDLADMFYCDLEAEYEYQNSDEQIAESIEANGYEFTEDGRIA